MTHQIVRSAVYWSSSFSLMFSSINNTYYKALKTLFVLIWTKYNNFTLDSLFIDNRYRLTNDSQSTTNEIGLGSF